MPTWPPKRLPVVALPRLGAFLVPIVLAGCMGGGDEASAASVTIEGSAYHPAAPSARAGEALDVRNADATTHTLTGNGFDTGDIEGGRTGTFVAPTTPGNYPFSCAYHAQMQGTLIVTAA